MSPSLPNSPMVNMTPPSSTLSRCEGQAPHIGNLRVTVAWSLPTQTGRRDRTSMTRAHASGDPFEALGDPHRRDILRLLSEGDKPVLQLAAALPISRPAVSRHLRLLKAAG